MKTQTVSSEYKNLESRVKRLESAVERLEAQAEGRKPRSQKQQSAIVGLDEDVRRRAAWLATNG